MTVSWFPPARLPRGSRGRRWCRRGRSRRGRAARFLARRTTGSRSASPSSYRTSNGVVPPAIVGLGRSSSDRGKVMGSLPEGFTSPNRMSRRPRPRAGRGTRRRGPRRRRAARAWSGRRGPRGRRRCGGSPRPRPGRVRPGQERRRAMDQVDEAERGAVQALRRPLGREDDGDVARRRRARPPRPRSNPSWKRTVAAGAFARMAASGDDGSQRTGNQKPTKVGGARRGRCRRWGSRRPSPPPESTADVGVRADDGDGAQARRQREAVRRSSRSTVPCSATAWATARFAVASTVPGDGRAVVETHREDRAHDPVDHVVEPGLGHLPGLERGLHLARSGAAPGISMSRPAIAGAARPWVPYQSDTTKPGKAQSCFRTPVRSACVLRAPRALQEVVGGHHRLHAGVLHPNLEGEQVGLAGGALVDDRVHHLAPGLLVVHREVLDAWRRRSGPACPGGAPRWCARPGWDPRPSSRGPGRCAAPARRGSRFHRGGR